MERGCGHFSGLVYAAKIAGHLSAGFVYVGVSGAGISAGGMV